MNGATKSALMASHLQVLGLWCTLWRTSSERHADGYMRRRQLLLLTCLLLPSCSALLSPAVAARAARPRPTRRSAPQLAVRGEISGGFDTPSLLRLAARAPVLACAATTPPPAAAESENKGGGRQMTLFDAVALVGGSAVGGGFLAIPDVTAPLGFLPSTVGLTLTWAYFVFAGLAYVEAAGAALTAAPSPSPSPTPSSPSSPISVPTRG